MNVETAKATVRKMDEKARKLTKSEIKIYREAMDVIYADATSVSTYDAVAEGYVSESGAFL